MKHIHQLIFIGISSKVSNPKMIARRVKRKCLNWWNRSLVIALASHLVYEKNLCYYYKIRKRIWFINQKIILNLFLFSADDASGRYTNSFLWGNSYYVGSATQCAYIGEDYKREMTKIHQNGSIEDFNIESRKKNSGLSGKDFWIGTKLDKPPYKLGFYIMTISVNNTLFPTVNNLNF